MAGLSSLHLARYAALEGMKAHQFTMKCAMQNLAHAGLKSTKDHDYVRKIAVFNTHVNTRNNMLSIKKRVKHDNSNPFLYEYSPNDPDADERGFIKKININPHIETVDITNAKYNYTNCLKMYELMVDIEKKTNSLIL